MNFVKYFKGLCTFSQIGLVFLGFCFCRKLKVMGRVLGVEGYDQFGLFVEILVGAVSEFWCTNF
jgi:hypothetical protein